MIPVPPSLRLLPAILALAGLAACNTPAPSFFGAERHELTVGGTDFVVFQKGDRAEVIRHGWLPPAARADIPERMRRAATVATGCQVVKGSFETGLPGDTGEARMDLICGPTR